MISVILFTIKPRGNTKLKNNMYIIGIQVIGRAHMGLFDKKYCIRCGKELGLIFGKVKVADGHICKDCNALLSPLITNKSKLTLADIEEHLKYRQENKNVLSSFRATTILGNKEKIYFDDNQNLFLVSSSNDYVEKNVDVISLNNVSSCQLVVDENEEEIFTTDSEGNEVSYSPERYTISYSYKIELVLNHRWVKELTIDVSDGEINEEEKNELLRIDNIANEIVAKINGKEFTAKTSISADQDHWQCQKCGQANELSAKFCVNCGEAKSSGQKFCGECGTKLPEKTKFCPNCGKAVN